MRRDNAGVNNPVVLITGASRGIGAATALLCARRGYDVAVNYARDALAAAGVVAQVQALGRRAVAVAADVSREADVLRLFATVDGELGPLAALVNNAGVVDVAARVDEMSSERLTRMFAVNVLGTLLCAREAVRRMSTRHGGAGGAIVNLSSAAARLGRPASTSTTRPPRARSTSSRSGWRARWRDEGIRVNAVRPGIIATDIHASGGQPDRAAQLAPQVPMRRAGSADEVAQAIVWLLSDAASYTTGAVIDVSGGR